MVSCQETGVKVVKSCSFTGDYKDYGGYMKNCRIHARKY